MEMPTLESEIKLIETFSEAKVIAVTINHEGMSDSEIEQVIVEYEDKFKLPTTDVLKQGCGKLIHTLFKAYPELRK
jgi:uncharacterized NAD-dependent epimerase/dehydratase family protein